MWQFVFPFSVWVRTTPAFNSGQSLDGRFVEVTIPRDNGLKSHPLRSACSPALCEGKTQTNVLLRYSSRGGELCCADPSHSDPLLDADCWETSVLKADDKTPKNLQQDGQLVVTPYPHGEKAMVRTAGSLVTGCREPVLLQMGLPATPGIVMSNF